MSLSSVSVIGNAPRLRWMALGYAMMTGRQTSRILHLRADPCLAKFPDV
jgi:hypothetical protein